MLARPPRFAPEDRRIIPGLVVEENLDSACIAGCTGFGYERIHELFPTTILVEQNAVGALKLSDTALILDTGEIVFSGSAAEVLDNEQLRHDYLAIQAPTAPIPFIGSGG